jgi:hypothetical protein
MSSEENVSKPENAPAEPVAPVSAAPDAVQAEEPSTEPAAIREEPGAAVAPPPEAPRFGLQGTLERLRTVAGPDGILGIDQLGEFPCPIGDGLVELERVGAVQLPFTEHSPHAGRYLAVAGRGYLQHVVVVRSDS